MAELHNSEAKATHNWEHGSTEIRQLDFSMATEENTSTIREKLHSIRAARLMTEHSGKATNAVDLDRRLS
jgi:hypothetical protein